MSTVDHRAWNDTPHCEVEAPSVFDLEEVACWACGRPFHNEQDEWRVQVRNNDSISFGLMDERVCRLCAERSVEAIEALRKSLV